MITDGSATASACQRMGEEPEPHLDEVMQRAGLVFGWTSRFRRLPSLPGGWG